MESDIIKQAKQVIEKSLYLNIASVTHETQPWNTPVYYTIDTEYNFYWYSALNAKHSQNIRINPTVFLTIYSIDTSIGLYIQAKSVEVNSKEVVENVLTFFDSHGIVTDKVASEYLGDSPIRIYKATPQEVYISTPETAEKYHNLWLSKRVKIKLSSIET